MNKIISVIVPVYNSEKYLNICIESILHQTYPFFELLLIDDGSKDQSRSICEEYSKKDNRVKLIAKSNGGASSARNLGLDICKGDYISFVDSDDILEHHFFERLLVGLEKGCDFSCCQCIRFFDDSIPASLNEDADTLIVESDAFLSKTFKERGNINVVWNKLYKKETFSNLRFSEGRTFEDVLAMHLIIDKANKVFVDFHHMYFFRKHKGSVMDNNNLIDLIWVHNQLVLYYSFSSYNLQNLQNQIIISFSTCIQAKQINRKNTYDKFKTELTAYKKTLKKIKKQKLVNNKMRVLISLFLINILLPSLLLKKRKPMLAKYSDSI